MAGLTGFKEIGWELACRTTQVGPKPESYYSSTLYLNLHYGQLLIHCLFEVHDESSIKAACDVIAKKYRHNSFVIIETNVHMPFDCYAVGYCVAASGHEWRLNLVTVGGNEVIEMLAVHEINLGPTDIQALSHLIKSRPTSSLKLKIGDKDISSECVALMMETLLSASSLEILELWWIKYNHESAKMFKLLKYSIRIIRIQYHAALLI